MTGLKIVKKRLNGDALVGLEISIPIDGEVDHCQERVGVDMIVVTGLLYGLVAEAQTDTETAQRLQEVVVVADKRDHLVIGLVHFLIFHRLLPSYDYGCKIIHYFRYTQ